MLQVLHRLSMTWFNRIFMLTKKLAQDAILGFSGALALLCPVWDSGRWHFVTFSTEQWDFPVMEVANLRSHGHMHCASACDHDLCIFTQLARRWVSAFYYCRISLRPMYSCRTCWISVLKDCMTLLMIRDGMFYISSLLEVDQSTWNLHLCRFRDQRGTWSF